MIRSEALVRIASLGLNKVMLLVERDLDDDATGFAPALDRAFAAYISLNSLGSGLTDTTVAAEDEYGFTTLMRATTYDLILPEVAVLVDTSIDAPLTSAKFSQMFRAFQTLRDSAWKEAALYGYGAEINVGGFRTNLDFREPHDADGTAEFG